MCYISQWCYATKQDRVPTHSSSGMISFLFITLYLRSSSEDAKHHCSWPFGTEFLYFLNYWRCIAGSREMANDSEWTSKEKHVTCDPNFRMFTLEHETDRKERPTTMLFQSGEGVAVVIQIDFLTESQQEAPWSKLPAAIAAKEEVFDEDLCCLQLRFAMLGIPHQGAPPHLQRGALWCTVL